MHVQVDGSLFGQSTNIFSVYADPELKSTWQEYNLKDASLVVSCMLHRYQWPRSERLLRSLAAPPQCPARPNFICLLYAKTCATIL
jgi:hypothetical protein